MAMLDWTKLNPTVKQIETKKLFFGLYLNKAVVYAPGGRFIKNGDKSSVQEQLDSAIALWSKWISNNHVYQVTRLNQLKECSVPQLEFYKSLIDKNNLSTTIRIEEPNISIYCNDEKRLYNIVNAFHPDRLRAIHKPFDEDARTALSNGRVLVKKITGYDYRILLKPVRFDDVSVKNSIADFLYNMQDEVKVPKGTMSSLSNGSRYFNGGYFYAKDLKANTFIKLMCPELISGFLEVTNLGR